MSRVYARGVCVTLASVGLCSRQQQSSASPVETNGLPSSCAVGGPRILQLQPVTRVALFGSLLIEAQGPRALVPVMTPCSLQLMAAAVSRNWSAAPERSRSRELAFVVEMSEGIDIVFDRVVVDWLFVSQGCLAARVSDGAIAAEAFLELRNSIGTSRST